MISGIIYNDKTVENFMKAMVDKKKRKRLELISL